MACVLILPLSLIIGFAAGFDYRNEMTRTIYDYVVVGSGAAGAVIANQLAETGEHSVLCLEAGGPAPIISEVPIYSILLGKTEMDWTNMSEPQTNACQGNRNGRCWTDRAKALGGSTSINFMSYVRGNKRDFDNWENLGCTGWGYQNVLNAYKKLENLTDPTISDNGYHGTSGYQTISTVRYTTKIGAAYFEAIRDIGYEPNDDYNGASQTGISKVQITERDGLRCSTEKAFLRPAANWDNLDILTHAFVHKVNFDDHLNVKSVTFDQNNEIKEVSVGKEVIVSAGTMSSPLILMRSGIGPKDHLKEMKIDVLVDSPGVGQNLQDHAFYAHLNYKLNDSVGIVYQRDVNPETIAQLAADREGPMTSPAFVENIGFISTKYENRSLDWPDILFFAGSAPMFTIPNLDFTAMNATGFSYVLLRPKSKGYVQLRSNDPHDDPIVDPKYFTDPDDINRLIDGTRKIMEIMKTPTMLRYNPELTPEILPACPNLDPNSDEYIECALRSYALGGNHLTSSCKMGNPEENDTVVDPQLRVKGVKGLRVADASIMPEIVSGNPMAACIMIGQRASDIILGRA